MRKLFFMLALLCVAGISSAITVVDHPTTGADDEIYNSLPGVVTGNGPAPAASGDTYQRYSLDAGDAIVQSFTTTEEINLDSIYIGYNNQQTSGTVRLAIDFDPIPTYGGPYDVDISGIVLSGLQTDGDNNGPVHYLQFDLSDEGVVLPAGTHRYIIWGETEDATGFIIAPIRNFGDTYAGGSSNMPNGDDHIFAITKITTEAHTPDPSNGDTLVAVDLSDRTIPNNLSWNAPDDPNIAEIKGYDLYLDPNETNVANRDAGCEIVDSTTAGVTQYDPASDFNFDTPYHWIVDTRYTRDDDPNLGTPNETIYVGSPSVWNFTTTPEDPVVTQDPTPAYIVVDAGEPNIVLTSDGINGDPQWYKDGSPLSDGADYGGTATKQLEIFDVQLADEGNYTVKYSSLIGDAESAPARVMTKRLTSHYPFETTTVVDGNDVTPDIEGGFDAVLLGEGSLAAPVLADANSLVGKYLLLDNVDHATDPNGQFAQIPAGVADYEDITISVWAHPKSNGNWGRVVDFGNNTSEYLLLTTSVGTSNAPRCAITLGSWNNEQTVTGWGEQNATGPGSWYHLAVTISGDTGRLYRNGELIATNTGMTLDPLDIQSTLNYIGKSQYGDPEFDGLIDELKIYNYARTSEQIGQDYLAISGDAWVCNWEIYDMDAYDVNDNCLIDLPDFAALAARWLEDDRVYPAP